MTQTASRDERPWVLLSLAPLPAQALQGLFGSLPVEVLTTESLATLSEAEAGRVELILADWRPGSPGLDADAAAKLPKLAFVQQPSVGVQSHDAEALAGAGIPLSNVAGFNAAAVMEWTVGAALSISRMLRWAEDEMRAGRWPQTEIASRGSSEIAGKSVGIVGFGPIGQGCARVFGAFGCPVSYWSRSPRPAELEHGARYEPDVRTLVVGSEILINAVALAPLTRGLLNADMLALLPPGALVISNSRGGIVDEDAVVAMLASGALAGAAFDVYDQEPLPADSSLLALKHDRLLLSPHVAGSTVQSNVALIQGVAANIGRAVSGAEVKDVVNGVSPLVRRR
ncbi:MAG: D-isomer specific 2-hydroxyacid dehydrogenase NAD-binding protein [Mycobacterium sp.]|nr:D-isomer specific 2-hydroxyacid dehydrogenase NAD-binding protein [Mycobacterium sp.]